MYETIGKNIAELRKQKGITQEALADIFGVSIDRLFGRKVCAGGDVEAALAEHIIHIENREERLRRVFDLCWTMEIAMLEVVAENGETIDDATNPYGSRSIRRCSTTRVSHPCGWTKICGIL